MIVRSLHHVPFYGLSTGKSEGLHFEEFDDQTEWFLYSDAAKLSIFLMLICN